MNKIIDGLFKKMESLNHMPIASVIEITAAGIKMKTTKKQQPRSNVYNISNVRLEQVRKEKERLTAAYLLISRFTAADSPNP